MSGFAGLVQLDGAAADAAVLGRMSDALLARAPHGRSLWHAGPAALAHARLDTGEGAAGTGVISFDGRVHLVADARIDGRAELRRALAACGRHGLGAAGDAELVLHAWHAWGTRCCEHLRGDFAFALWDARERRLFCARDPLGVKPLFHARTGDALAVSNTLASLRRHPRLPEALDALAVADFLLFDCPLEPDGTTFAAIRRLPAGHWLEARDGSVRLRRYWRLPEVAERPLPRAADYVARLRELLDAAVRERVGGGRAAVLMSGGLDSTAVAAGAARAGAAVRAFTIVYEHLIPDRESAAAQAAAGALGIPMERLAADGYGPWALRAQAPPPRPQPPADALLTLEADCLARAAAHAPVVLTGWDGDTLLEEPPGPWLAEQWRRGRYLRLAAGLAAYLRARRRLPPLGLRARLRPPPPAAPAALPGWLNPSLVRRLALVERWREHAAAPAPAPGTRPHARGALSLPVWDCLFERYDAGVTGIAAEVRHPWLDLRLVEFLLSVPPVPWCAGKHLLREALAGVLPEPLRRRPKTPLAADPVLAWLRGEGRRQRAPAPLPPRLDEYVDRRAVQRTLRGGDPEGTRDLLPVLGLGRWLDDQGLGARGALTEV